MYYLVRYIWNNRSIISEHENLSELRMVRFRKDEDWSPWNCILLTMEESAIHLSISDIENVYDSWLLRKVKLRHMLAKIHFLPLLLNDRLLSESNVWFDVSDSGKFLHPSNVRKFAKATDFDFLKSFE